MIYHTIAAVNFDRNTPPSFIKFSPPFCAKILTEKILNDTKQTAVATGVHVVTSNISVAQAQQQQQQHHGGQEHGEGQVEAE